LLPGYLAQRLLPRRHGAGIDALADRPANSEFVLDMANMTCTVLPAKTSGSGRLESSARTQDWVSAIGEGDTGSSPSCPNGPAKWILLLGDVWLMIKFAIRNRCRLMSFDVVFFYPGNDIVSCAHVKENIGNNYASEQRMRTRKWKLLAGIGTSDVK